MARPHVDTAQFVAKGSELGGEAALMSWAHGQLESLHIAVQEAAALYPEGWFGGSYKAFASISTDTPTFEHTDFEAANASPVLREFFRFLSAFAVTKRYRLDSFQSTPPDLTEIFWPLPFVPETRWVDTGVEVPRSPLPFKRTTRERSRLQRLAGSAQRLSSRQSVKFSNHEGRGANGALCARRQAKSLPGRGKGSHEACSQGGGLLEFQPHENRPT